MSHLCMGHVTFQRVMSNVNQLLLVLQRCLTLCQIRKARTNWESLAGDEN